MAQSIRGYPLTFTRRKYGTHTYTWACIEVEGQSVSLGDPYPGVHWRQSDLDTAVLQAIIANYLPLVCEEH